MSSIRGLSALIAMMLELTTELNYNPVIDTSLHPNHDMDIEFDVRVTTEDLVRINEIRKQMNLALFSAESVGNRDSIQSVR